MPRMWVGTCFAQQQNKVRRGNWGRRALRLVGAASPERRKLPREFDWSSVLLSVMGALSVLLGCDMINTCCCLAVAVCVWEVFDFFFFLIFCIAPRLRGVCLFFFFFVSPQGAKNPEIFFHKAPIFAPAKSYRPFTCVITIPSISLNRVRIVWLHSGLIDTSCTYEWVYIWCLKFEVDSACSHCVITLSTCTYNVDGMIGISPAPCTAAYFCRIHWNNTAPY